MGFVTFVMQRQRMTCPRKPPSSTQSSEYWGQAAMGRSIFLLHRSKHVNPEPSLLLVQRLPCSAGKGTGQGERGQHTEKVGPLSLGQLMGWH